jgi:FixJ family two-component response regulator
MNANPIIVIDDDDEDIEMITPAFKEIKVENDVITFCSGEAFLNFIRTTDQRVFFILCDINMSRISGLELKKKDF